MYAYENTIIISDILDPESWNLTTQSLTLDPIKSDYITGMCLWQGQQIAIFRNGSTWMVQTGPNLPVLIGNLTGPLPLLGVVRTARLSSAE